MTSRGFHDYLNMTVHRYATKVRLYESSLALDGAHCWLVVNGPTSDHLNDGGVTAEIPLQLTVVDAVRLAYALLTFVTEAEQDRLTEPAHRTPISEDDEE